MTVDPMVMPAP